MTTEMKGNCLFVLPDCHYVIILTNTVEHWGSGRYRYSIVRWEI